MTKNIKKVIVMLLIAFIFLSVYAYNVYNKNKVKYLNCVARMVYLQGKIDQRLTLSFTFNAVDSSGVVHIEGEQLIDGINSGFINRNIHFTYKNLEDSFILTSTEIRKIKGETISQDEIQQTFPEFYSTENRKVTYIISKQKNDGYLFLIAGTPRFFCEK